MSMLTVDRHEAAAEGADMTEEPRRARHLMDPSKPRPPTSPEDLARLDRVQRWVLSVLAVTTIGHLALGLVLAALLITEDSRGSQVGLCVIAGVTGMVGVAAGFAIHRKSPLNPWLLVGLLPGIIGLYLALR
jgi:hypothetical protein